MRRRVTTMILILQAVLVMLATVVSTIVGSIDLPSVPEDSEHMVELEGSEPLPNPDASHRDATHQLPHGAVYPKPRNWNGDATTTEFSNGSILSRPRKTWFQRHCSATVTTTVYISPTVVPELPELPEDYCNGPGQFLFGATNECFLYLSDGLRTFEDADAECRKGGMRLAKPKKPKAIQKHLVTVLGHSGHVWLGARGDGHSFKWQTNDGASIRNTDPNWWHGLPAYHVTNEYCLALVAYPNAVKQEKVFYPESCSLKRTALCQRSECSPECTIGTCTGPNTCSHDPRSHEIQNVIAVCPDGCDNGQCTAQCTCSDGYIGNTCDKKKPNGFTWYNGRIVLLPSALGGSLSNWQSSKQRCLDHGSVPFIPKTVGDFRFIQNVSAITLKNGGGNGIWLPANDIASEGTVVWPDGTDASTTLKLFEWRSHGGVFPGDNDQNQDCLNTWTEHKLEFEDCSTSLWPMICEFV